MMSVVIAAFGIAVAHAVEDAEELLAAVRPAHRLEDAVAARLQRHVQLRHDRGRLGHRVDDVVGEGGRVRAREADALEPVDLAGGAQQLAERLAVAELDAVGVDVLAEQRDLDRAVVDEQADLVRGCRRGGDPSPCRAGSARCRTCRCCCSRPRSTPSRCRRESRLVGRVDGKISSDSRISSSASPLWRARSSRLGSEPMLWVPKTTSTHGAFSRTTSLVHLREAAADGDLHAVVLVLDATARWPSVP